jgi:Protein of unknown function (DUF2845)
MSRYMIHRFFVLIVLLFLTAGVADCAGAVSTFESILCNNKVVSVGDTKQDVLMKCGEPLSESYDEVVVNVDRVKRAERWTYKIGGFYRFFVIEGGVLQSIEAGSLAD